MERRGKEARTMQEIINRFCSLNERDNNNLRYEVYEERMNKRVIDVSR